MFGNGAVRVVLGKAGVARLSKKIGQRNYFRREVVLGASLYLSDWPSRFYWEYWESPAAYS